MMWLKRLMTWLCPPKASVRQQLHKWQRWHMDRLRRQYMRRSESGWGCAMPPTAYRALLEELEQIHGVQFGSRNREGIWFERAWCYPDPTVTEFTAR